MTMRFVVISALCFLLGQLCSLRTGKIQHDDPLLPNGRVIALKGEPKSGTSFLEIVITKILQKGCSNKYHITCPLNIISKTYITYAEGKMAFSYTQKHYIPGLGAADGPFRRHHREGFEKLGPLQFRSPPKLDGSRARSKRLSSTNKYSALDKAHSMKTGGRVARYGIAHNRNLQGQSQFNELAFQNSYNTHFENTYDIGHRRQLQNTTPSAAKVVFSPAVPFPALQRMLEDYSPAGDTYVTDRTKFTFVLILRDPRDVAISECYHIHRKNCQARLSPFVGNRLPVITAWVATRFHWHNTHLRENTEIVWYDNLVRSDSEFEKLCALLGVPCTKEDIDEIRYITSPKKLLNKSIVQTTRVPINHIRSAGTSNYLDYGLSNETLVAMANVLRVGLPVELQKRWL